VPEPVRTVTVSGRDSGRLLVSAPSSRSITTTPDAAPVRSPTLPREAQASTSASSGRGRACQPGSVGRLPDRGVKDQPRE
jgi:hypothetical protein